MLLDRIVRLILPRQGHFFELLEQVAAKIDAAATVFRELETAAGRPQIEAVAARLKPIETETDGVCHQLYEELDRTFVTPIDREDLATLTKTLDDVVDEMEHTAAFAALYRFDGLTEPMRQLVRITVAASGQLTAAVRELRRFSDSEVIRKATVAVHLLENEADLVYRGAIAALFSNGLPTTDVVRQKDMLLSLESGVDQCKDAMDVIRSVVVKNG